MCNVLIDGIIVCMLQDLKAILDGGNNLPFPDGLIINGRGSNGNTFTVDQGSYSIQVKNHLLVWFGI